MNREIVTLRGFDDAGLGGRVRKGATFDVSQQYAEQLVNNGLAAYTSAAPTQPAPLGNESAAGKAAPSSASPAVPPSPSATVARTSRASTRGDSDEDQMQVRKPSRASSSKKRTKGGG